MVIGTGRDSSDPWREEARMEGLVAKEGLEGSRVTVTLGCPPAEGHSQQRIVKRGPAGSSVWLYSF